VFTQSSDHLRARAAMMSHASVWPPLDIQSLLPIRRVAAT